MRRRTWLVPLLGWFLVGPALASGLYRWTDPAGHVQYGDAPPPNARQVIKLNRTAQAVDTSKAPALDAVRQATSNAPVVPPDITLVVFVTDCGEVCQLAKGFMGERSLPYREIDPKADDASRDAFLKASPNSVVPTLLIEKANGETTAVNGYNSNQWYESLKKSGVTFPAPGKVVLPNSGASATGPASSSPPPNAAP